MSAPRNRRGAAVLACAMMLSSVGSPANAWADDVVLYEVLSGQIAVANIEWQDATGRRYTPGATLPWRAAVPVQAPLGPPPNGSQIRAEWRRNAWPAKWVTVRISYRGKVICQNTLDVGNAACYGATARVT
ncbi:hypothetical protein [Mycolicibacterium parafortuitum]|uniref:Uncharacterized protein n=1 Tax=Mycolicibacterium parafortuitum TaxID=39692 RepID=A0A375YES8_MYCPF|nr:hypothetical protein MPP7335_01340 [Mycolicibacterium parafortuitum]